MVGIEALIENVGRDNNTYKASIKLLYKNRSYVLTVSKLVSKPVSLDAKVKGDYIVLELKGENGKGFATCCIHIKHVEKGCLECPSLVVPP